MVSDPSKSQHSTAPEDIPGEQNAIDAVNRETEAMADASGNVEVSEEMHKLDHTPSPLTKPTAGATAAYAVPTTFYGPALRMASAFESEFAVLNKKIPGGEGKNYYWDYCVPPMAQAEETKLHPGAAKTSHSNCRCATRYDILDKYLNDEDVLDEKGVPDLQALPFNDRITVEHMLIHKGDPSKPLCGPVASSHGFSVCPVAADCQGVKRDGKGGYTRDGLVPTSSWFSSVGGRTWDFCVPGQPSDEAIAAHKSLVEDRIKHLEELAKKELTATEQDEATGEGIAAEYDCKAGTIGKGKKTLSSTPLECVDEESCKVACAAQCDSKHGVAFDFLKDASRSEQQSDACRCVDEDNKGMSQIPISKDPRMYCEKKLPAPPTTARRCRSPRPPPRCGHQRGCADHEGCCRSTFAGGCQTRIS